MCDRYLVKTRLVSWSFHPSGLGWIGSCSKVKQSLYRPVQSLRVQEVEAPRFQDSRQMKGARLSALTHIPPRSYPWYSFLLRGWVDPRARVRPEGLCQWKMLGHALMYFSRSCSELYIVRLVLNVWICSSGVKLKNCATVTWYAVNLRFKIVWPIDPGPLYNLSSTFNLPVQPINFINLGPD